MVSFFICNFLFKIFISVNCNGNSIPLPPRDRSKTLPAQKQRHQRKHPLIIPGIASRTIAKLTDDTLNSPTPSENASGQLLIIMLFSCF